MCLLKVLCQTCSTYILLSSSLNFCICKQRRRRLIKIKSTLLKERELHLCTSLSQTTGLKIFFVTLAQKLLSQVSHRLNPAIHINNCLGLKNNVFCHFIWWQRCQKFWNRNLFHWYLDLEDPRTIRTSSVGSVGYTRVTLLQENMRSTVINFSISHFSLISVPRR